MPQILKPSNLSLTWASGGDILDPGNTKYATGWQVEIPPRQWFNYLDNRQDTAIAHFNQHGIAVWDSGTEYQADKSYAQGPTNGTIYRCVQTHTNQNPETDVSNTYWIIAFASAGDFYTKTETDGRYLAKSQNLADLTNTATARANLGVYGTTQTYTKTETDGRYLAKSQNLADLGNVATARSNLGLGTAATKNVGTGSGNLMGVGAFGLGALVQTPSQGIDLNTANLPVGFYSGNSWRNTPLGTLSASQ